MTDDLNVREAWLNRAVDLVRPRFEELGSPIPEKVKVSIGWSKGSKANVVGTCWPPEASSDGETVNIFLVPTRGQDEVTDVCGTLIHELQHAAVGTEHAHKGPFVTLNRQMGFLGKPTSSAEKSPELLAWIEELLVELGPFPHAAMVLGEKVTKQATYMLKLTCPGCQYSVRTTAKMLAIALPICPNDMCDLKGEDMAQEVKEK